MREELQAGVIGQNLSTENKVNGFGTNRCSANLPKHHLSTVHDVPCSRKGMPCSRTLAFAFVSLVAHSSVHMKMIRTRKIEEK